LIPGEMIHLAVYLNRIWFFGHDLLDAHPH
jgi:hypothetical protein